MNNILFIFGEGGHTAQMKRLTGYLSLQNDNILALVDKKGISDFLTKNEFFTKPLRKKHNNTVLAYASNLFDNLLLIAKIAYNYKVSAVISTGPGICLIPSIIYRLLGRKVIFLETWSRFETKSFTGKCMYYVASHFYVQNKSLLELYPNAIYCGRL